jgi:hypothetical protein
VIAELLVAQLTIVASGPPLAPADAAATLRRASPDLDLSRGLYPLDALPVVLNITRPAERELESWIDRFDRNAARLRALDRDRAPNLNACPPSSRTCVIIEEPRRRHPRR